jgi:putative nucleotidyltransferase with HDIG domain
MTLAGRVFLWMAVPTGTLLVAGFVAAGYTIEERVKDQVRQAQRDSESRLRRVREDFALRNRRLLGALAENPSLKAGLGLLRAGLKRADVRRTLEDQMIELADPLSVALVAVADADGKPVAGLVRKEGDWQPFDASAMAAHGTGLLDLDGRLFNADTVPVNLDQENIGHLSIADEFRLEDFPDGAVLLRGGKVIASNLPAARTDAAGPALAACPGEGECRVRIGREQYMSLPLDDRTLGGDFRLRLVESLDAAGGPWKRSLRNVFGLTGFLALLAAVGVAGFASRAVAAPINTLIAELRITERLATLPAGFATSTTTARSTASEVRELAAAFNRAAAAVAESQERLEEAHLEFIEAMAHALDARDVYTAGHSRRVSEYSCSIARELALSDQEIDLIRIGALLHDIGKLGVPDSILRKPGRLTEEEAELVRQHPVTGAEILREVRGFECYIPIVELHHENPDGTGYPRGLVSGQIPREVAIVHVADAYDAMTSDRPYRVGLTHEVASEVLRRNSGTQFEASIVEAFLRAPIRSRRPAARETGVSQLSLAVESAGPPHDPRV